MSKSGCKLLTSLLQKDWTHTHRCTQLHTQPHNWSTNKKVQTRSTDLQAALCTCAPKYNGIGSTADDLVWELGLAGSIQAGTYELLEHKGQQETDVGVPMELANTQGESQPTES